MSVAIWKIDEAHSSVQFSVRHLVVAKVRGQFRRWGGDLAIDESDLTRSSVAVKIEAASVDTGHPERDTNLRSARFLDAETFPLVTFRSRRIERAGEDGYRVTGEFGVHGVTREVTFEAQLGGFVTDPWGRRRAGLSATGTVKRSEFGITWNQVLEAGGVAVGDTVDIAIEIEAVAEVPLRATA